MVFRLLLQSPPIPRNIITQGVRAKGSEGLWGKPTHMLPGYDKLRPADCPPVTGRLDRHRAVVGVRPMSYVIAAPEAQAAATIWLLGSTIGAANAGRCGAQ